MIKCSKCGYMNDDDSLFCEECGEKLEKEEKCPSCGAPLKPGKKFCAKCGYRVENSGISIGDKNVIGGDVVGKKEETKVFGSQTIVKNEDQTKQVRKCHICGSLVPITHGFECPECGEFTCENCFDSEQGICIGCAEQKKQGRETQYKKAFQKAMADGKIEFAERKELFALQKSLGLDSETARRLEEEQKREGEEDSSLSIFETKIFEQAKASFYDNGDHAGALGNLEPLYQKHPYSEEVLDLYLPVLACSDRNKAVEIIKGLGADILMAYVTDADIAIKSNKFDHAEQILKKAKRIWPDNVLVDCYRAMFYYALYKKFGDSSFLKQAKGIADSFGEASNELELSYSILVSNIISESRKTGKTLYDKAYCKENNLYWYVVNSNPFLNDNRVCTVGKDADCDFFSIQDAIDSVSEGGTITVRPGVYKEDLVFSKVLTLKGSSEDIKDKSSRDLPIVLLGNKVCKIDKPVKIEGMLFTHNSKLGFKKFSDVISSEKADDDIDESLAEESRAFVVISADSEIKNCAFIGAANNNVGISDGKPIIHNSYVIHCLGMVLSGSTQPIITECVFNGNDGSGLFVTDTANPFVEGCVFSDNICSGIDFIGESSGIYRKCSIHHNGYSGINVMEKNFPKFEECEVYENKGSALYLYGDSTGEYKNCKIHNNPNGVMISEQANPILEGLDVFDNASEGLIIGLSVQGTIRNCIFHNNGASGIKVKDKASPTLESCEVFKNRNGYGLFVTGDAAGTYRNCKFHDNKTGEEKYPGVTIAGQSNPTLDGCEIYNHLSYGIWIKENAKGTYKNCSIHDNESTGIKVQDSASPTVESCKVFSNRNGAGLWVVGDSTGTYRKCKIHDNKTEGKKYVGVCIAGQSNPTLEGCEIYNHFDSCIWVKETAKGTYKNCSIHDNESTGFQVQDTASPTVESCEVFNNRNGAGLWVLGEATGTYRNCKIHDNKTEGKSYVGVCIAGQSNPTLEGCEIYNHLSYGISIKDNARGTIRNCTGSNNWGIFTEDTAKPTIENCTLLENSFSFGDLFGRQFNNILNKNSIK